MPNPVVHWEIVSKDAKRIQDFYAKLFDWHVEPMEGMNYGIVDSHTESGISGGIGNQQEEAYRVTFYVQVEDLQAAERDPTSPADRKIHKPPVYRGLVVSKVRYPAVAEALAPRPLPRPRDQNCYRTATLLLGYFYA